VPATHLLERDSHLSRASPRLEATNPSPEAGAQERPYLDSISLVMSLHCKKCGSWNPRTFRIARSSPPSMIAKLFAGLTIASASKHETKGNSSNASDHAATRAGIRSTSRIVPREDPP
jgi:hypothetical protein